MIIVRPTLKTLTHKDPTSQDGRGTNVTSKRRGCSKGWKLLHKLREATERLERNENIPLGKAGDEWGSFDRNTAESTCRSVDRDELWENINPALDRLLGFGRPKSDICSTLRRGPKGVFSFCEYLEYLVEEGGVVGGLLDGKISTLISVIE